MLTDRDKYVLKGLARYGPTREKELYNFQEQVKKLKAQKLIARRKRITGNSYNYYITKKGYKIIGVK